MAKRERKVKGVEVEAPGVEQPGPLPEILDEPGMTISPREVIVSPEVEDALQRCRETGRPMAVAVAPPQTPYPAVEVACVALGLLPEHVAASRVDGSTVIIVTKGGQKLRWPDDIERAKRLTQGQKDGQFPGGVNPNSKEWHEPPEKNAALVAAVEAATPKEKK